MVEDLLFEIKEYCSKNDILVFEGTKDEYSIDSSSYILNNGKENEWKKFFHFVSKLGIKIIVIENKYNKINNLLFDLKSKLEESENFEDLNLAIENNQYFKEVIKFNGKIYKSIISFSYNQICYQLILNPSWIDEFESLEKYIEDEIKYYENIDNYKSPLTIDQEKEELSEEIIDDFLKEFILIEKSILSERDKDERKRILFRKFEDKYKNVNRSSYRMLLKKFEKIYDNAIRIEILKLKSQGLNKTKISSKLRIGDKLLNRHYETE